MVRRGGEGRGGEGRNGVRGGRSACVYVCHLYFWWVSIYHIPMLKVDAEIPCMQDRLLCVM